MPNYQSLLEAYLRSTQRKLNEEADSPQIELPGTMEINFTEQTVYETLPYVTFAQFLLVVVQAPWVVGRKKKRARPIVRRHGAQQQLLDLELKSPPRTMPLWVSLLIIMCCTVAGASAAAIAWKWPSTLEVPVDEVPLAPPSPPTAGLPSVIEQVRWILSAAMWTLSGLMVLIQSQTSVSLSHGMRYWLIFSGLIAACELIQFEGVMSKFHREELREHVAEFVLDGVSLVFGVLAGLLALFAPDVSIDAEVPNLIQYAADENEENPTVYPKSPEADASFWSRLTFSWCAAEARPRWPLVIRVTSTSDRRSSTCMRTMSSQPLPLACLSGSRRYCQLGRGGHSSLRIFGICAREMQQSTGRID